MTLPRWLCRVVQFFLPWIVCSATFNTTCLYRKCVDWLFDLRTERLKKDGSNMLERCVCEGIAEWRYYFMHMVNRKSEEKNTHTHALKSLDGDNNATAKHKRITNQVEWRKSDNDGDNNETHGWTNGDVGNKNVKWKLFLRMMNLIVYIHTRTHKLHIDESPLLPSIHFTVGLK